MRKKIGLEVPGDGDAATGGIFLPPRIRAHGSPRKSPADPSAAHVTSTRPQKRFRLNGTVSIDIEAGAGVGVVGVEVLLNTSRLGFAMKTGLGYSLTWDTTSLRDGIYLLTVNARDAAGNIGTLSFPVWVNNIRDNGRKG